MQLHKRFTTEQVTTVLQGYERGDLREAEVLSTFEIKRATFYKLLRRYRREPKGFTLTPVRKGRRRLGRQDEQRIKQALRDDQKTDPAPGPPDLDVQLLRAPRPPAETGCHRLGPHDHHPRQIVWVL